MKAWAIKHRADDDEVYYRANDTYQWTRDATEALLFAREKDAKAALEHNMPLLRGRVVEVTLTEGLQPVEKKNGDEALPNSD